MDCFFVSDLHGSISRYEKLFKRIEEEIPSAVFLGGDLLPSGLFMYTSSKSVPDDFVKHIIEKGFAKLKEKLKSDYPRVFIILGNDDGRYEEDHFMKIETKGLWEYVHNKKVVFNGFDIYGYSYIPPTPFMLKDWERYDVSRYVDPGCTAPDEGAHSVFIKKDDMVWTTIQKDIELLVADNPVDKAIFLFHSPPYQTKLDRAALDGKTFEHVPLDLHVGSIAIQRFIQEKQPYITLHGHVHESARITGSWQELIGKTYAFTAAHDSEELALVRFNIEHPENASRELV